MICVHGGVLLPIKIPKVKCFVCGQELKYINSTHLWMRHGMILAEYKEKFPDAEIMCEKEKERRKILGGKTGKANTGGIHSEDHKQNIGKGVIRYIENNKEKWHNEKSLIAINLNRDRRTNKAAKNLIPIRVKKVKIEKVRKIKIEKVRKIKIEKVKKIKVGKVNSEKTKNIKTTNERKNQCLICSGWFRKVQPHLIMHGLTIKQYKEMFNINDIEKITKPKLSHEERGRISREINLRREFKIVSCQKKAVEKAKEWAKNNPEKKREITKRAAEAAWAKKGHREKMESILRNNAKNIARPSKSQLVLIDIVKDVFGICEPEYSVRCEDGKLCLIDAAVPDLFLAFEIDGNFWHKNTKIYDEKREKYLNDEGWIVLHYNEDNNLVEDVACDVVSLLHGGIIDSSSVKNEAILNLLRVTSDMHKEEVML